MPTITVSSSDYRSLFRQHAGGVAVVTLDAGDGPAGCTVTSLTSVSLDPPLVSLAIDRTASAWPHLERAGSFVANFLDHDHGEIAQQFATSGIDRFAPPVRWHRLPTNEPVLDDTRRWLRALTRDRIAVGDHHLVIGEIVEIGLPDEPGSALVYHSGRFHAINGTAG